jgi:phage FluMu protein Com
MQLRCSYCQTMFAISRDEMLAALQHMDQHQQKYYDAHCPKCRRANRVEGRRIEIFFPDWKKTIKVMEREAVVEVKVEEKPVKKTAETGTKTGPNKAGGKVTASKKPGTSAAKPAPPAKPDATKKTTAAKKPAATKKPAAAKKPATTKKTGAKVSGGIKKK